MIFLNKTSTGFSWYTLSVHIICLIIKHHFNIAFPGGDFVIYVMGKLYDR